MKSPLLVSGNIVIPQRRLPVARRARLVCLVLVACLATASFCIAAPAPATDGKVSSPERWAAALATIEARHPAPAEPIDALFVGSSSIRRWNTLAEDFPSLTVLNRGFGGSQIPDSLNLFERLVGSHRPRTVVFYAGTNDIAGGKSPETVAADFRDFCARLHSRLPETRVIFIAMTLCPKRWELRDKMALANAYIAAFCAADPRRHFLDVNAVMLSPEGLARPELFVEDGLHLSPLGYIIWSRTLKPVLLSSPAR